MYIEEMKHLLKCLEGQAVPIVDGEDGRRVLQIALAAKESSRSRCEIAL
jgi:predicted dehydrogenase